MKNGIQIEIQKGLSENLDKIAKEFSNKFIKEYLDNGMKFVGTKSGYRSWYRKCGEYYCIAQIIEKEFKVKTNY